MRRRASRSHGFISALLINMLFRLEWLIAAVIAYLLHRWLSIPIWIFWSIIGLWVVWSAIVTLFVTWAAGCSEAGRTPGAKYASERIKNRENQVKEDNMALFDIFKKKNCDVCGEEIGLLGNRKVEDGNMCKNCANKLSPWFDDRKTSTIDQIKLQLEYREINADGLRFFNPTRVIGDYYKMFIEEKDGVPFRFVVNMGNDYKEDNADIIKFKDVSNIDVDINEHKKELKRKNADGEYVSYNPPRYEFQYDFYIDLTIADNPYFDNIRFKLNRDSVDIESELYGRRSSSGVGQFLRNNSEFDPSFNREYQSYKKMCNDIEDLVEMGRKGAAPAAAIDPIEAEINALLDLARNADSFDSAMKTITMAMQKSVGTPYSDKVKNESAKIMADAQMKATQQAISQDAPKAAAAPAQPEGAKFCPSCGAPADGSKFCQNCGTKLR